MTLCIDQILSPAEVAAIMDKIAGDVSFASGAASAGWHAKTVKINEQATGPSANAITDMISAKLLAHPVFQAAAQPKKLNSVILSRYHPGMVYGTHVDNPLMGQTRNDLSFTLFLSEPETYDGGALIISSQTGDHEFKLKSGSLVLYPTTELHRVSEVVRGQRVAVIGWVRSFIRNAADRSTIFDLENLIAALRDTGASRELIDSALKIRANLMQKWVED